MRKRECEKERARERGRERGKQKAKLKGAGQREEWAEQEGGGKLSSPNKASVCERRC